MPDVAGNTKKFLRENARKMPELLLKSLEGRLFQSMPRTGVLGI